jgi:uncharacterized delta-60 repeat protein
LGRKLNRRRRERPTNVGARAARANRRSFVQLAAVSTVAATMLASASVTAATPAPGSPDPTWGSGGRVATSLGVYGPVVTILLTGAVLLPDGKVVAEAEDVLSCTPCVSECFVARYTSAGTLDTSFGKRGVVTLKNGDGVGPLAALPDGMVVAGNVRLKTDGSVDASFHPPPTPAGPQRVWAIHTLPGGGLLESSTVYRTRPKRALFGLFRLHSSGTLDRSFGALGGGTVTAVGNTQYGNVDPYGITAPRAIALTSGGNVVVAGETGASATNGAFALLEYGPNGKLDPSFGTNGVALTPVAPGGAAWPAGVPLGPGAGAGASAVVTLPNGRLLVAGYTQPNDFTAGARIALARYLPNGTLDTTFGSAGIVVTPLYTAGSNDPPVDLVAMADGKLLVGPHNGYTTIARVNADGSLDPTFGSGGTINPKIADESLVVQPDGKIIVAGIGGTSGKAAIVVRRYLG